MTLAKTNYQPVHVVSCICMMLALAWLTISAPFVYTYQQEKNKIVAEQQNNLAGEQCASPVSEERTEGGINSLSEYLHSLYFTDHFPSTLVKYYKCHPSVLYFAFHPELVSPPPKV